MSILFRIITFPFDVVLVSIYLLSKKVSYYFKLIFKRNSLHSGEKDGHYFLKILQNETNRLLKLADNAESELQKNELSEEVIGKIHSAAGKARLLVSQKMQQFKGLCTNNITQVKKIK